MHKRTERIPRQPALSILQGHACTHVPHVSRAPGTVRYARPPHRGVVGTPYRGRPALPPLSVPQTESRVSAKKEGTTRSSSDSCDVHQDFSLYLTAHRFAPASSSVGSPAGNSPVSLRSTMCSQSCGPACEPRGASRRQVDPLHHLPSRKTRSAHDSAEAARARQRPLGGRPFRSAS
jgi:hypothetical protein